MQIPANPMIPQDHPPGRGRGHQNPHFWQNRPEVGHPRSR